MKGSVLPAVLPAVQILLSKNEITLIFLSVYFQTMPGKKQKQAAWRRIMRRMRRPRQRRQYPLEVKDWVFVWPEDADQPCDYEIDKDSVPRLGNNWIRAVDGCMNVQVPADTKTVSVKLLNVNYERVKRIEVNDGHRILFTAVNGNDGLEIRDGGYGPFKP